MGRKGRLLDVAVNQVIALSCQNMNTLLELAVGGLHGNFKSGYYLVVRILTARQKSWWDSTGTLAWSAGVTCLPSH